jgi:hypothetical protein
LSVDPKVQQTQQAYLYVDDDPVNGSDPGGEMFIGPDAQEPQYGSGWDCPSTFNYCKPAWVAGSNAYYSRSSWVGRHWRGIVTTVGVVAGVAAAATGFGAIADVVVLGVDAGDIATVASVVAGASDMPDCARGNEEACVGAAANFFAAGLGAGGERLAEANEALRAAGVEISIGRDIAPGLLKSKAFAIGVGTVMWDAFRQLARRLDR